MAHPADCDHGQHPNAARMAQKKKAATLASSGRRLADRVKLDSAL
jgi:hypothetical protein